MEPVCDFCVSLCVPLIPPSHIFDYPRWAASPAVSFAHVREDSGLDLALFETIVPRNAFLIASGGDLVAHLAPKISQRLLVVDQSPVQLELTAKKLDRTSLHPPERQDWNNSASDGKYERLFAWLRRLSGDLTPLFAPPLERPFETLEWKRLVTACHVVFSSNVLRKVFGPTAVQGAAVSFDEHFINQLAAVVASPRRLKNPWLEEMLLGEFRTSRYPWLEANPAAVSAMVTYHAVNLETSWPDGDIKLDYIGLSNVTDWMGPDEAVRLVTRAWNSLAPGGILFIRQLNSTHNFASMCHGLNWRIQEAALLLTKDRSFFYSRLYLARKP